VSKIFRFLLYVLIIGVMGSVAVLRLARGCSQFFP